MVAASGTQWLGLGQGNRMAGANMLVMYASGSNNITLSPRSGKGQFEPDVNSAARVTLLDGTGISTDGVMIANIRCDSCITWDGGSMSPTSGQSNWIWGIKHGSALNSGDVSADILAHDAYGAFTFDLPAGTSSDSANPFVQAATETQSAGSSPSSSSGDSDESSSESSSSGSSASSGESESPNSRIREAHGVIMALVFVLLFPLGALTIYLPFSRKTLFVHAPLQLLSASLLIAGVVLGVVLGVRIDANDGYHQIIGYVIVGCLVLFQPALGVIRHRQHRRGGKKTIFGHVHPWLGRILILIGIINGGLGLHISGDVGSEEVPKWSVIVYGVVAGVVGVLYIAVASGFGLFRKRKGGSKEDMKYRNGNNNANNAYMGN
jgi:Cytochrome domain of cellobiose dehydrogenase